MADIYGDEVFPKDTWVKAIVGRNRGNVCSETYYMVTSGGAFVRISSWVEAKKTTSRIDVEDERPTTTAIAEAITFMPGSYTLKLKSGKNACVVLRKTK